MAYISEAEKIDKVKNLDMKGLNDLMIAVLEKKGFSSINTNEDCITAVQSGLIGSSLTVFITFEYKLSGNLEESIDSITERVKSIRDKYTADSVIIYSQNTISNGFREALKTSNGQMAVQYLGRDELITIINEVLPDFWRHEDMVLLKYEKDMLDYLNKDNDLRKLKFPKESYGKLLNVFVEPRLVRYYEDSKTKTAVQKNYSMSELIAHEESCVIDGPAGFGKTTLLKSIARTLIESNGPKSKQMNFPIFLSSLDIFENNFNIGDAIRKKIGNFTEAPLSELAKEYKVHLLIDSIDEFDDNIERILDELQIIKDRYNIKYYIASRNYEIVARKAKTELSTFSIRRFNIAQVKLFINAFFSGDESKTSSLIDAIKNNQMIERLPMSPLTLSLITILFEEKELEIPATISDIYDNFNTLIIGKAIVSSKIEFIDISFKERILSIYAYEQLQEPNHIPYTKNQFIEYFKKYYDGKSLPLKKGTLEDVLEYLMHNTGILYLKDGDRVHFSHDSYMEYYAALEIFKHRRAEEEKLITYFLDPHWQNAAVFYAGMSKDLPDFLIKIKEKIAKGTSIGEYMSAILGAGYILQALYQTDNKIRRDVVIEALKLSIANLHVFKVMAAEDHQLFKNYNLPILTFLNFVYFYESFNSITLQQPLSLAFDDRYSDFQNTKDPAIGYNLLELAFSLDSKRIKDQRALSKLIYETPEILKDPILNLLASISFDFLGKEKYHEFIAEMKKTRLSLSDVQRDLLKLPMSKLRFSAVDNINRASNVTLFVEGGTDATILEHAYIVLTNTLPYWKITAAGPVMGKNSCEEVAKTLLQCFAHAKTNQDAVYIGIFDHDSAGLGVYRGRLEEKFFDEIEMNSVKKHKEANIYGLCLPVPGEMDKYLQPDQVFNFFEIEHYFGEDFLKENDMLEKTAIPEISRIKDTTGAKTSFAKKLKDTIDPKVFEHFLLLFKKIDELAGVTVEYVL